jgi:hypothetical protein
LNSPNELLEHSLCVTFILQKEYPIETGKVINNYLTIFVTTDAYLGNWSK